MSGIAPQAVLSPQATDPQELWFRVDASAVPATPETSYLSDTNKAALPEGYRHAFISKTSSVFTITLREPSTTLPIVQLTSESASRLVSLTSNAKNEIEVTVTDLSGTPTDGDFQVILKRRARNSLVY